MGLSKSGCMLKNCFDTEKNKINLEKAQSTSTPKENEMKNNIEVEFNR